MVSGRRLPAAGVPYGWLVAADAALSSCIIVAWRCEPHASHVCRLNVLSELVTKSQWVIALHGDFLFGLSCQFCRQRRCLPHLVGHSVRLLLVPFLFPHILSPRSSCSIPPRGPRRRHPSHPSLEATIQSPSPSSMAVMTVTVDKIAGGEVDIVASASAVAASLAKGVTATGAAVDRRIWSHRFCWWAS